MLMSPWANLCPDSVAHSADRIHAESDIPLTLYEPYQKCIPYNSVVILNFSIDATLSEGLGHLVNDALSVSLNR